jgi:hypothetical protein
MVPKIKPMRKTVIAESAPALVARSSRRGAVVNDPFYPAELSLENFIPKRAHPA